MEAEHILITLDYNKIITEIAAPARGTVIAIHCELGDEVHCELGDEVQVGDRIIELCPN